MFQAEFNICLNYLLLITGGMHISASVSSLAICACHYRTPYDVICGRYVDISAILLTLFCDDSRDYGN